MTTDAAVASTTISLLGGKPYKPTFTVHASETREPIAVVPIGAGVSLATFQPAHLRALALTLLLAADKLDDEIDVHALRTMP